MAAMSVDQIGLIVAIVFILAGVVAVPGIVAISEPARSRAPTPTCC